MPRRPSNLETTQLTIELLKRISRTKRQTARDFQEQLAEASIFRDLRTVQRHLELLCQHFDIDRDERSKPYGYRWKEQAAGFSVPSMTPKEALLLSLAHEHLRNLLPQAVMKSMHGFFEQAQSRLTEGSGATLERQWPGKVRVVSTSQPLLPPPIRPGVLEEVSQALYANTYLEVEYGNAKGKRSRNDVLPLGLAQQGASLYLVVKYLDHEDLRLLAVHRIRSAKTSTLTFERPPFDFKALDEAGRFGFSKGGTVLLRFKITRSAGLHLLETRLSGDQQVEELPDHFRVSATVVNSEWLWRWVRAFGLAISEVTADGRPVDPLQPYGSIN